MLSAQVSTNYAKSNPRDQPQRAAVPNYLIHHVYFVRCRGKTLRLGGVHNIEVILLVLLRKDLVGEGEVGREEHLGGLGLSTEK